MRTELLVEQSNREPTPSAAERWVIHSMYVTHLVEQVQLLDADGVDLVEHIQAGHVAAVALNHIDQVVRCDVCLPHLQQQKICEETAINEMRGEKQTGRGAAARATEQAAVSEWYVQSARTAEQATVSEWNVGQC